MTSDRAARRAEMARRRTGSAPQARETRSTLAATPAAEQEWAVFDANHPGALAHRDGRRPNCPGGLCGCPPRGEPNPAARRCRARTQDGTSCQNPVSVDSPTCAAGHAPARN